MAEVTANDLFFDMVKSYCFGVAVDSLGIIGFRWFGRIGHRFHRRLPDFGGRAAILAESVKFGMQVLSGFVGQFGDLDSRPGAPARTGPL